MSSERGQTSKVSEEGADQRGAGARGRRRRGAGRGESQQFNPMLILSILPVVVFWAVRRVAETQVAIGAGFGMSLLVFAVSRRSGVIGWLALAGMVVVGGASVVGLILESDKAYLANDPVGDFVSVLVLLGSLVVRRPLIGVIACELFPRLGDWLDPRERLFYWVTAFWAGQNLVTGVVRVFMLQELSVDSYLVWSRAVSWPLGMMAFGVSYYVLSRAAQNRAAAALVERAARVERPTSGVD